MTCVDPPFNPTMNQIYTSAGVDYYWDGKQWVVVGSSGEAGNLPADYVLRSGDSMRGFLTLHADPTAAMHAATKQYADAKGMPGIGGGVKGQALVIDAAGNAVWGAPIEGGNF
jgi:hypothetical protein